MNLLDKFEFRTIKLEEIEEAILIEQVCFPPHEACSPKSMRERIFVAKDLFFVAMDKETGKMAGFLNGIATQEERFRDEFFTNASLHEPKECNIMLLGLDVLPEYRNQGLAHEIVKQYIKRERLKKRRNLILTCLAEKVSFYQTMGFQDLGLSDSCWGGEPWNEMCYEITK